MHSNVANTGLIRGLRHVRIFGLIGLLAGCAQFSLSDQSEARMESGNEAASLQSPYQQGMAHYRENRFDLALADLTAAIANHDLTPEETINARKHIAFIHCSNQRELPCREQFQAILKVEQHFDLAPNEAGHPAWGPVWRSVKAAQVEQQALAQGRHLFANAGHKKLTEGKEAYDAGRYSEAIALFQTAIGSGELRQSDKILAHKYAAFAYCLTNQRTRCRIEFRTIFALDPTFRLQLSEAGHPAWKAAFLQELSRSRKTKPVITKRK